ncbi:DUF3999 family protein [Fulvivirga sp. 29W222]|uniref:DUF3999 family protein n=2 Tax=Fulvivirga marina TaxID=2494733 RepID=A0A937FVG0_9BACT|nr:DUF3999 family protein [Fulvivirga marina]
MLMSSAFGQMKDYRFKRELREISELWHKIILPNDIFSKVSHGLSDIRIYGITTSNDTLEAPYVLRVNEDTYSNRQVDFNLINSTHNRKGYYYTFEVPSIEGINHIQLDFQGTNFDRYVTLEGSHDQKEWFTILKSSRVLSIENSQTQYTFTSLTFPSAKYQYIRLFIPENGKMPILNSARLTEEKFEPGNYVTHDVLNTSIRENQDRRQTEIELDLESIVSVSQIKVNVVDQFDYYRPVSIEYLHDSVKTPNGWKKQYRVAFNGMLSSLESNEFRFRNVFTHKVRVVIRNFDNNPLKFEGFVVKGNVYELHARFTEPASYILVYGNDRATSPNYDIVNFANKIPEAISTLTLGQEEVIDKVPIDPVVPIFENKTWLWVVMGLIIFVLGWFSVHMIRK